MLPGITKRSTLSRAALWSFPKLYNGRNKTFWLSDYAINHEHTINLTVGTVPTPEMLNGDFSFAEAPGGGLPIYNPFSTRLGRHHVDARSAAGQYHSEEPDGSRRTEVSGLGIWNAPNQVGSPSRTGPSGNLQIATVAAACTGIAGTRRSTISSPRTKRFSSAIPKIKSRPEW